MTQNEHPEDDATVNCVITNSEYIHATAIGYDPDLSDSVRFDLPDGTSITLVELLAKIEYIKDHDSDRRLEINDNRERIIVLSFSIAILFILNVFQYFILR